ncbi:MAG: hypothetical protein WDM84_06445 [Bauldia sp.]
MFKQAILAVATAGVLATGGLAVTTSAASAAPYGGQGWNNQNWNHSQPQQPQFHPRPFCRPVIKNVKWWDRLGRPHWKQIVVAGNCGFPGVQPYPQPHQGSHPVW